MAAASEQSGENSWLEHKGGEHDVIIENPKGPVPKRWDSGLRLAQSCELHVKDEF